VDNSNGWDRGERSYSGVGEKAIQGAGAAYQMALQASSVAQLKSGEERINNGS